MGTDTSAALKAQVCASVLNLCCSLQNSTPKDSLPFHQCPDRPNE